MPRLHPKYVSFLSALILAGGCEQMTMEDLAPPAAGEPVVKTVDRYYSPYSYGPLLKLFEYPDENAVLMIRVSNRSREMPFDAKLHLFAPATTAKDLARWINNQHSDALYADAPEPFRTMDVSKKIMISSKLRKRSVSGRSGEEYQQYDVSFAVAEIRTSDFRIPPFEFTSTVHVLINDPLG